MSEMNREEVIKWLEKSAPVCVCSSNAFEEYIQAVNKQSPTWRS